LNLGKKKEQREPVDNLFKNEATSKSLTTDRVHLTADNAVAEGDGITPSKSKEHVMEPEPVEISIAVPVHTDIEHNSLNVKKSDSNEISKKEETRKDDNKKDDSKKR